MKQFITTLAIGIFLLGLVPSSVALAEGKIFLPSVFNPNNQQTLPYREQVCVPAGEFTMGCDPTNGECESLITPALLHEVYLDEYYIDKYEVTNARYEACVDAGACTPLAKNSSATKANYFGNPTYASYPVIYARETAAHRSRVGESSDR